MAINVKGIFLCCKAVFPQMKKQAKGKIINIASGTVLKGTPNFLHYVTSKAAVIGLTRALAREVGPFGVRVNAIAPGYTLSEGVLAERQRQGITGDQAIDARSLKRSQQPQDLTGTVVYLASDDSDFLTGQTICVDGGSSML
jgi:NAD(P)-dependent dehydrogenase (short-subunit alcohol dehydrogenase family)